MWAVYALLGAVFAAATSILAKVGLDGINSNLGTAVRTAVVLVMAWGIVFATGVQKGITEISSRSWLFLVLSGIATGASWLFFFRALQMGPAAKVVPIDKFSMAITMLMAFVFLGETVDAKTIIGGVLITAGTLVLVL
jgi:transporter family protein